MKRESRATRRRPMVESLDARTLLSGSSATLSAASEIFVKFQLGVSANREKALLAPLHASLVTTYPGGSELIRLGSGVSAASAVLRLSANTGVVYATLDLTIHTEALPFYPNDPAFPQLWGLNNANNVDIDAPETYGVTTGSPSVIVAVLDTGIDLGNPDFAGRIWTNPGNDSAGGFPNDIHGWNFISNNNNVQDDDGHGTHVSAVIGAQGNNAIGVVGVAPAVQLMPLKFLDANGNGSTDEAVSAIYFAVNHGARVINASWGGVAFYGPLAEAIAYANTHNVVFVTAAGNDGINNDITPSYPASFREPNELSVASVDRYGSLPSFSNFGASTVDIAAPGVDIISDVPTSISPTGLESLDGTSMSTAYVSGVAALVASAFPTATASQIVTRIDSTAKLLPSMAGKTISGGMVDAFNAVVGGSATLLNPPAPASGIPALIKGATSVADLHAAVLASDEFFAAHGSNALGFIAGLYQSALGRLPDLPSLQHLVDVYSSGQVTRFQLADLLLTLPEGRQTEVARWFQVDLGRTASLDALKADAGVDGWASLLLKGYSDDAVRAAIMSSSEFLNAHGSAPIPVVQGYYVDLTGRSADSTGLNDWAHLLYVGVTPFDTAHLFLTMPEVKQTLVASWFRQDLGRPQTLAQLKANPGLDALAANLSDA